MGFEITYFVVLSRLLRLNNDHFAHVPASSMRLVRGALIAVVVLLGSMIVADGVMTFVLVTMGAARMAQVLSGASGAFAAFIYIVLIIGIPLASSATRGDAAPAQETTPASAADHDLMARLSAMLTKTSLFRDSNLTLVRVARRLGITARDVSGAVNRVTGENVSRHIDSFRIGHAQTLLRTSDLSVTEAMLEARFISKSSFNAEFRRITGTTPSTYRSTSQV